ncbi:hypothetical protein KH5H1_69360 [Corallococcus caeni]|nr:hypothetical protein KH5H1_69360 [Corallococcus sp. KH5-1]
MSGGNALIRGLRIPSDAGGSAKARVTRAPEGIARWSGGVRPAPEGAPVGTPTSIPVFPS